MDSIALQERVRVLLLTPRCGQVLGAACDSVAGLIELAKATRPKNVLEIGSHKGVSTEIFLLFSGHVTALDPWDRDGREVYGKIAYDFDDPMYKQFMERCGGYSNLTVIRGYSPATVLTLPKASFDLVYIDAIHSFEAIKVDIAAALPLVQPGGWIAGHDYNNPPENGVAEAILEMLGEPDKIFQDSSWVFSVDRLSKEKT